MSDLELGCSRRVGAVFIEMRCYQQSVDADNSSAQTLCLLEMSLWSWVSNPLGMFRKHTVSEWAIAWLSVTEFFQTKRSIATNPRGKPNGYFVVAVVAATLTVSWFHFNHTTKFNHYNRGTGWHPSMHPDWKQWLLLGTPTPNYCLFPQRLLTKANPGGELSEEWSDGEVFQICQGCSCADYNLPQLLFKKVIPSPV